MITRNKRPLDSFSRRTLLGAAAGAAAVSVAPDSLSAECQAATARKLNFAAVQLNRDATIRGPADGVRRAARLIDEYAHFAGYADLAIFPSLPVIETTERTCIVDTLTAKAAEHNLWIALSGISHHSDGLSGAVFGPTGDIRLANREAPAVRVSDCAFRFSSGTVHLCNTAAGSEECMVAAHASGMRVIAGDGKLLCKASTTGDEIITVSMSLSPARA